MALSFEWDEEKARSNFKKKRRWQNAGYMKNKSNKTKKIGEMRAEYNFSGGARGKHAAAYRQEHSVTIHKKDGTTVVQNFKLEEGAILLEPDVREYFPDAESVNKALRTLIAIAPRKRGKLRASSKIAIPHP
ncbi:MAG TPA: hypothetical protein PLA27_07445 [Anaerolineales bacterium]|jgi:hypothetical protein|nr:hypothetical protein [Anaerolineales bacterium]